MYLSESLKKIFFFQEWRTHQVKSINKYESSIENLEPGKEYEFMVLSQDRYNDGLFSKAFRFRTKGECENYLNPKC